MATLDDRLDALTHKLLHQGGILIGTSGLADGAVTSAKILDGSIVDADINATAAIAQTKLAATTQAKINGALQVLGGVTAYQAGSTVQTTDGSGNITVAYPVTFSTTPQCVILTNGEDGQGVFLLAMVTRNANNFTFKVRNTAGAPATGALVRINWMAAV